MKRNNLRQNELDCLNRIKDGFIYFKCLKKVFDSSDYLTMKSILNGARQNENHNDFPDFFFNGGIIEHFEVTASDETRKGSQYKIDDAYCQREKDKHFKRLDKEFIESPYHPGTMRTETAEDTHECFSYESFVKSFKRNVEHHLDSLKKTKYTDQLVIFLIEQQGASLCAYINNIFNRFYRLSEDRNILEYIKETLTDVDYIIFVATDRYEVIDLSKIDVLIQRAKTGLDIRGGRQKNISLKHYNER